ncbi:hypothetical protein TcasGA2_TC004284 [Tribolium castaneum]|uniref:Uncharacterized protein n=1 Tax=Tribolium castaneum TaxID=7070 RepID=D7EK29_TRICA|nr:hypothetical protein TcasGA2_TC004284 [Tribolium castaneum]
MNYVKQGVDFKGKMKIGQGWERRGRTSASQKYESEDERAGRERKRKNEGRVRKTMRNMGTKAVAKDDRYKSPEELFGCKDRLGQTTGSLKKKFTPRRVHPCKGVVQKDSDRVKTSVLLSFDKLTSLKTAVTILYGIYHQQNRPVETQLITEYQEVDPLCDNILTMDLLKAA